jgi:hypothetical protein
VIIFSAWDTVGILRDHWSYSDRFTRGMKLVFGVLIEELVFFIVVPICELMTYEAVGSGANAWCDEDHKSARGVLMPELTVLTAFAMLAVVVAELVYFRACILTTAEYWWTIAIIFAFEFRWMAGSAKFSAPIVIYNPEAILGLRGHGTSPSKTSASYSPFDAYDSALAPVAG